MTHFMRVILKGVITTQANFHIGTGKEEINDEQQSFNQLCLDSEGNPYIPASSLRGYLRHVISQHASSSENKLFGLARQDSNSVETGNSGALRIYDCSWDSDKNNSQLISQTSIDPITATAKHHQLSTHAVIPPDSRFKVHLELDKVSEQEISVLLKALNTLSKANKGKLGKGKSTGQGECHWQLDENGLTVLTAEQLRAWLKLKQTNRKYTKKLNIKPERKLSDFFQPKELSVEAFPLATTTINFQLKADSPLLINNPQAVLQREKENKKIEAFNKTVAKDQQKTLLAESKLIYIQKNNKSIIPGSTLKGWVRARARRILLTLLDNKTDNLGNETWVDELMGQLFGSTQQQGCIGFDDATVEITEQDEHQQTFTAIDRFTGGAKGGALYKVEAIWPKNSFKGQIHYPADKLQGWMKLLLLYILKDSMEGDLVLGWGKSKGYGRLTLEQIEDKNWEQLYPTLNPTDLEQWDNALQQKLTGGSQ